MTTPSAHTDPIREAELDDPSGRLAAYMTKTQTPLDLLALMTLWIVVVPPGDFGTAHHASTIAWIVRIGLSVVYGIGPCWPHDTGNTYGPIRSASSWS
jgi:hypothetical protein